MDAPAFTPARRQRVFEVIVTQIRAELEAGRLRPGDRLPAERDLCQSFGVGRPALREALRALEAQGVVEIRTGPAGGVFVAAPDASATGSALSALIQLGGASAHDLAEFRVGFEQENARWAARRATPADMAELGRLAGATARLDASDPAVSRRFVEIDVAFHDVVARSSGNGVRVAVMAALHDALARVMGTLELTPGLLHRETEDLADIAEAIGARDEERAAAAMAAHVARFSRLEIDAAGR